MDLDKCKNCNEMRCIIAKANFNTSIDLAIIEKKRKRIENNLKSNRKQFYELSQYGVKYFLSKNQLKILELLINQEIELTKEISNLYN